MEAIYDCQCRSLVSEWFSFAVERVDEMYGRTVSVVYLVHTRGGSRTSATSKMEHFVIIVNGFQPLTIITKRSILDVAAVLAPSLEAVNFYHKALHLGCYSSPRSASAHLWGYLISQILVEMNKHRSSLQQYLDIWSRCSLNDFG